ncbi:flagellar basal body P-ring biosynthesis protein [Mycolicibacterium madagascariense]|uniref:Flagellar basal body P-ring biosynthesis protein n=1 Tax=Mycolicibacterium madagascariense TaxID=212765 RepID=A0A7I7XLU2_9MYCO|nr:SAF domain-containing protein [Mycolicibacterium madagascariense]MCV7012504.1 SAF domain-containing protein [Mycolicibacterium madagascariense]BBZ30184.1 flagellar basal body P-ring biosynthesis protein [Mycolicibacterium madagascariense]
MAQSLNPSRAARLLALRPDWTRTAAARRTTAGALVVLAAVVALRPDPSAGHVDVVVAARDLAPGHALAATDLNLESRSATTVPDGAQADVGRLIGATLTGPARRGEVVTDVRVLSSRLADATAGPDARIVPIHPADAALLDLVRPGDVVDVLTVSDPEAGGPAHVGDGGRPRVVATGAVVVLVSAKAKDVARDGVVLVALPAAQANDVAGASLSQEITLTFH